MARNCERIFAVGLPLVALVPCRQVTAAPRAGSCRRSRRCGAWTALCPPCHHRLPPLWIPGPARPGWRRWHHGRRPGAGAPALPRAADRRRRKVCEDQGGRGSGGWGYRRNHAGRRGGGGYQLRPRERAWIRWPIRLGTQPAPQPGVPDPHDRVSVRVRAPDADLHASVAGRARTASQLPTSLASGSHVTGTP